MSTIRSGRKSSSTKAKSVVKKWKKFTKDKQVKKAALKKMDNIKRQEKMKNKNRNAETKAMENLLRKLNPLVQQNRNVIISTIRKSTLSNAMKNRIISPTNKDPLGRTKIVLAKVAFAPDKYTNPVNKGHARAIKTKHYAFINDPGQKGTVHDARRANLFPFFRQ